MKIKLKTEKVDHNLSKNDFRMVLRLPDRNLWFLIFPSFFAKIAKNPLFTDFHQISKMLKNRSRYDLGMPGTSLESLRFIFFKKINCINKIQFLMPFCNQNDI